MTRRLTIPTDVQHLLDAGGELVVSVSGGKDSTAVALALKEAGLPFQAIHMDTGWEHRAVYDYARETLPSVIGPVKILRREVPLDPLLVPVAEDFERRLGVDYSAMVRLALHKALLPSRVARWCTEKLKVEEAARYIKGLEGEPINVVDIRADESKRRAALPETEESKRLGCLVWRPIHSWGLADVIDIHQRHGIAPCSLYFAPHNAVRVGCYPCIFARKAEMAAIAEHGQERIAILRDLEEVVTHLMLTAIKARGEEPRIERATWFYGRGGVGPTRIDDVVEWAMGERRWQIELFDAGTLQGGCVRWGMCDTGSAA